MRELEEKVAEVRRAPLCAWPRQIRPLYAHPVVPRVPGFLLKDNIDDAYGIQLDCTR